ncbi:flagellar biosynthesis, cell-distal portion of basal-body rod [Klebsiella pneumoniae]|nr:flagellar biosynthesis, cell-distal portion of basal-body rod [Klebsiella pneumoniae]
MTNDAAEYDLSVGLIPDGNAVYIREIDTQFLASEYINIDGILTASGRKRISQESVAPFLKLLELITYISDDEYEGSSVDSAGMDSAGRWLWKWITDVLWLKNLVVTGELTATKAEVEEINAGQVTINGIPVKSVDNVDYLNSDEYAGALFDSALVSENLRWLMGWIGDRAFFKKVTLGSLLASIIDVDSLTIAGVPYQSYLADASEFEGSVLVSAVLDENNRIISGLSEGGEIYPEEENDFRAFVDDKNLKVLNIHTARMAVFATDTDFTNVRNESDYFVFNSPSSDAVAGEIMSPYNAWLPVSEYGRKTLALWGHSFIGNNTSFSLKLSQLTGYPAYNFGRSGATSVAIALRNGAYTKNYQPAGGVIPATGDVALTPAQPGPLQIVGDVAAEDGLRCSLAGIDGVINWTGTEMIFTRSEAGSAVSVTGPTPLEVYPYTTREIGDIPLATRYDQHRESVNILWIGRNNASSIMQILSDMKAITDRLARQNRRFVVLPEFPMASEVIGTNGQAQVMYLNSELKRLYPGNYCEINGVDLLQNFKNHYNPDYPQDVEDIANGITPTSLRQDTLHPSQSLRPNALFVGTEVNAIFVHQFMVSKGWL